MSNRRNHSTKATLNRHMVTVLEVLGLMLVVTQDLLEATQDLTGVEAQDPTALEEGPIMGGRGHTTVAEGKDLEV